MKWSRHFSVLIIACCYLFTAPVTTTAQSHTEFKDEWLLIKWNFPDTYHEVETEDVWLWGEDDLTAVQIFLDDSKDREDLKRSVIEGAGNTIYEQGEKNYNGMWSFWVSTTYNSWPDYWAWCIGFMNEPDEPFVVLIYFKKNNDQATKTAGDIYSSFKKY